AHRRKLRHQPFITTRAEHQRGACLGQTLRELCAEATRSARDDGDASGQIEERLKRRVWDISHCWISTFTRCGPPGSTRASVSNSALMRAVVLKALGDPEQLIVEQRPDPHAEAGEVIVGLRSAALNRRDVWIRRGQYAGIKLPIILGSD